MKKTLINAGAATLMLVAGVTSAQTTTPGVPSTGTGGELVANLVILMVAAIVAVAGAVYAYRLS